MGPVPPLESEAFDRLDSGPEQPTAHYRMVSGADHLNTLADTTKDAQVRIDATSSSTAIAARSLKYVPLRARDHHQTLRRQGIEGELQSSTGLIPSRLSYFRLARYSHSWPGLTP